MKIKFEITMEIADGFAEEAKNWEHHAERLLDLDSYSEIKSVSGCKVTEMELRKERYEQMLQAWDGDVETVESIINEWGIAGCNKGYAVFDSDNRGILQIEQIDDVNAFNGDNEKAVEQAIKDGIKIIPVEELPENMPDKWYGYIDTPKNRERIAELYGIE